MIDARVAAMKLVLAAVHYSGLGRLAAPTLASAGAILMLHRVTGTDHAPLGLNSGLAIRPAFLDRLLADLRRRGVSIVCMDELVEAVRAGRSAGLVAVTADDGYLDNLNEALPVLEAHDAPMTIYVAPGLTNGDVVPWWEGIENHVATRDIVYMPAATGIVPIDSPSRAAKRAAALRVMEHIQTEVPEDRQQVFLASMGIVRNRERQFMNWEELRRLAAHRLVGLGAHTVGHVNLARLPPDEARREMADSATVIEMETGLRPRHFAYPYGGPKAAGAREAELARELGFASAVTTRHGVLHPGHAGHLHALPRISVNGNFQKLAYVRALLSGVPTPIANRGRRLVTM